MSVRIENEDNSDENFTAVNASSYKSYGWLKKSTVKILGTKYFIVVKDVHTDNKFREYAGYEDYLLHQIVLADIETCTDACYAQIYTLSNEAKKEFEKEVLRHELIHAFFDESGLRQDSYVCEEGWAVNEEMVDWISLQLPKIYKVYEELGLVE